jgi:hypothetical protein
MSEPVVACGWEDQLALADVLILPTWEARCDNVFTRWPGLAMVVFPLRHRTIAIVTRDGRRLAASGDSIVDTVRMVYEWWSLSRSINSELAQPCSHRLRASGER